MLFDALTVSFALHLLLGTDFAQALPSPPSSPSRALHVPLLRRAVPQRNDTELGLWAKQQKQLLEGKYGGPSTTKRSSGTNLCVSYELLSFCFLLIPNQARQPKP